ncbi:aspartate/tyrosine/aromatic aminotransferase [Roseibacterium sp. SDUM158016]|uniref:amino acid aminotransferase n=1 Tax=Roseicyclus sediminis TaxID=2980997 RepID=UPI0021D32AD2|nr:amino acid aminotransferase [Roseibacterium sp. SDUM158016]MCU4651618.1 aspartate/tyrosine/aromatic aminotransferase [Roseibacterium sp. SDUM158016]
MFENRLPPEPDKILRIMAMFAGDPRTDKVDLGVGVYRSPDGRTPVMAAVKEAERRIWDAQETKSYVGLSGDPAFLDAMRVLILGDAVPAARVAACGTPGGTGAVRQVLEMTRRLSPEATVWISDPTWPNHPAIIDHLSQKRQTFRYYDAATGGIDRDGMFADLARAQAGDLILLHACCHNPTGADLTPQDWEDIAAICEKTGAIPFVDMAYLGFAESLEDDAAGTRLLAARLPEVFIAASCSKNFGLYRERVGVVLVVTGEGGPQAAAFGTLANLNRQNYAFPPDHGARIVQTILGDAALAESWRTELRTMRETMLGNRRMLADALRAETGSDRFGFFAGHRGMFSLCGGDPEQVRILRETHGIYLIGDGRMNVAGLTAATIPQVARALAEVLA